MTEPERILGVAIMCRGVPVSLPEPYRHHHVIRALAYLGEDTPINGEQGFVTSAARFVNRVDAKALAVAAGQYNPTVEGGLRELYSEDLW